MRISVYHIFLLLNFLFCFNQYQFAQLVINDTATPEELVENMVADNISYFNITYIGDSNANGIFSTNNTTDLGMEDGIILTSGEATIAIGPNNTSGAGSQNYEPGHPLLNQLFGYYSGDASVLEFEFVPTLDLITCKSIFGSEEYPEGVGFSVGNESFGLFISGPDPLGSLYIDSNFAVVPNSNLSISVDHINNITPSYPELYVDNTNGLYIQYDGYTTVIDLYFYVIPDSVYSIKLMIGDCNDLAYDSGVFIEKNSFKSVNSTELLSFGFKASNNPELIEDYSGIMLNDSVFVSLPYINILSSLTASFIHYPGTSVYVNSILQTSDSSSNDFTEPVTYKLLAGNGNSNDWTILVNMLPNSENEILEFTFLAANNPGLWGDFTADIIGQNILIDIPEGTDLSNLIASFTLSDNASAFINGTLQESGITSNNYNDTLVYVVEAENGDTGQYFVSVNLVTGIENSEGSDIRIYPNPTSDFIFIENIKNSNIRLYNYSGNLVKQSKILSQKKKIPVDHLPTGVYFIQVNDQKSSYLKKIIIK